MTAPIIDVHAHYFPPAFTEAFERLSGGRKAWPQHPVSLDDRAASLTAAGVDVQVNGLGHNQPYFADPAASVECARLANDISAADWINAIRGWQGLSPGVLEGVLGRTAREKLGL